MKALVATIFAAGVESDDVVVCTGNHCHCCLAGRSGEGNFVGRRGPNEPGGGLPAWLPDDPRGCREISCITRSLLAKKSAGSSCLCSPVPPAAVLPRRFRRPFLLGIEFELRVGRSAEIRTRDPQSPRLNYIGRRSQQEAAQGLKTPVNRINLQCNGCTREQETAPEMYPGCTQKPSVKTGRPPVK